METAFYIAAAIAIAATALAITRHEAVHGLLYLIVSLLAVAMIFFILGAPFAAALEVIIYAGAIMVLFVFVVMLLNLGHAAAAQERRWLGFGVWFGPTLLSALLLAELLFVLTGVTRTTAAPNVVDAEAVGIALFGSYLIGVELASMLLLAGLVGAYHLGRRSEADGV